MGRIASVCSVGNSYFSDSPGITVDCVGTPWVTFISFFPPTHNLAVNQYLLPWDYFSLVWEELYPPLPRR